MNLKCKLVDCLNNVDGSCDCVTPTVINSIKLNDESCLWYETDVEKEYKKIKNEFGGFNGMFVKLNESKNMITKHNNNKAKWKYEFNEYTIKRMGKIYQVTDKSRNKVNAKPILLMALQNQCNDFNINDWKTKATRRIGNELMRRLGVGL